MKYLSLILILIFVSCKTTRNKKEINNSSIKNEVSNQDLKNNIYEQTTVFKVCSDYPDIYQLETVDKRPLPVQGEKEWLKDFYKALRYPPDSREKGIEGTVKLELMIDFDGNIESIGIIQLVAPDIDEAAVEAFRKASKRGFTPAIFKGRPVKSIATVPLHFRLG